MQVQAVRVTELQFAGRSTRHGKENFKNRVATGQQGSPRGNPGIARRQHDGDPAHQEPQQIGTPITQKNLAIRVINQQKPEDRATNDET